MSCSCVPAGTGGSGSSTPSAAGAGRSTSKPLTAGETATLEYSASLHYPAPPPPEFRRIVQSSVENLDIRVEFHPGKLPGSVVWAVWDGMDGPIVDRENVALDSQFAVHRYLRLAEKTVVGFHWDW